MVLKEEGLFPFIGTPFGGVFLLVLCVGIVCDVDFLTAVERLRVVVVAADVYR